MPAGVRWAPATRETAERIARSERIGPVAVRERLKGEHGIDVPLSTLCRWLEASERRAGQIDVPTVEGLSDRALALASSELSRLERSKTVDLDRLAKVTAIVRSVAQTRQGPKVKRRTLADLSDGPETPKLEAVRLSA